ncbi:hypothetical protein VTN00DRAFT_5092 [Thermoascus crustaceus]|uniref:uncharacterized protein n=1 Tax=Thermoascus crustaceus TaxID=5088 RepID=UPI003741F924
MPKRKRSEQPEDGTVDGDELPQKQNPEDRKVARQASRLSQKYEHGAQTLHKALKTARGFERQKLGRRQKTARSNNNEADLQRMEAEVHALKSMDLAVTAERYLFKQLAKTKRIAESPAFAKFKESKPVSIEGPRDTAEANVIARLMKSNPVKNVMPGIMSGIRELLGLDDAAAAAPDAKKVKASKGEQEEENGGKDEMKAKKKMERDETKVQARREQVDASSGEEDVGEGDGEEEGSENANDSDADSIDYSKFDSRLAPSSGESDAESDEGSESEEERPKGSNNKSSRYDRARDLSLSPTPSAASSESPPPTSLKGTKKSASASKAPTKSTTFLPSLMMGGYWSGSESEPEDLDSAEPPRRKNRMGQKARRALWEKKYGDKANHIQKEKQKQKQSRDSGWDMRRGATDADGDNVRGGKRGKGGAGAGKLQSGQQQQQQQGAGPNNKKSAEDRKKAQQQKKARMDKPLHPSWEAARRQKEQKAQASFQGKKIVFD